MSNSVGIIDAGYRGCIKVALDNMGDDDYVIDKGTRLFQICCPLLSPITLKIVDCLSETSRGEGGFGSTDTGLKEVANKSSSVKCMRFFIPVVLSTYNKLSTVSLRGGGD